MGYEVHVTRRANWFDEGDDISLEEWRQIVGRDPELRMDNVARALSPAGDVIEIKREGIAVWLRHPRANDGDLAWICYSEGRITVKNPDPPFLMKMHEIATKLSARVQGDEGEEYDANGDLV
jgi:hypothetical protein